MKIALVYDRINKWGGAERVLLALHEIWPEAPLYTAVYDPAGAPWAGEFQVIPSFLNKLPLAKTNHDKLALLMPLAFESFDFSGFDVVISITSEAAKGIITKPETLHLCYCLTPTRYLWSGYDQYFNSRLKKLLTRPAIKYLRTWDLIAAQRPDKLIAISKCVRDRIKKYYNRDSEVIYPPVDVEKFQQVKTEHAGSGHTPSPGLKSDYRPQQDHLGGVHSARLAGAPAKRATSEVSQKLQTSNFKPQTSNYFLVVSRLVPYKRFDIAIEAFNRLGLPLKVVGEGSDLKRLQKLAHPNVEFLGSLTDDEVIGYYRNCRAVIFPSEEDFGLVPLEAQACGRPVIAYKGGGALETVIDGKTGRFFWPQTAEALGAAVREIDRFSSKGESYQNNCRRFGKIMFQKRFRAMVTSSIKEMQK